MSTPTAFTLFSGGGLADVGMKAAGFQVVGAVEYDARIAEVYALNHGADHLRVADVAEVDYRPWSGVEWGHVSPSCKNASQANSTATETEQDRRSATAVCRMLREARPRFFTLENVGGYRTFDSFAMILAELRDLGYSVRYALEQAANYGVPQTRRRLILRACRDGERLGPLAPTHCEGGKQDWSGRALLRPWVGWYAAIEDLIDGLPESELAEWQKKRLDPEKLATCLVSSGNPNRNGDIAYSLDRPSVTVIAEEPRSPLKALLVHPNAQNHFFVSRAGEEPSYTVATFEHGTPKAVLVESKNANQQFGDGLRWECEPATSVITDGKPSHVPKAILLNKHDDKWGDGLREAVAPAFTIPALSENRYRALLEHSRCVRMTPRALARFQGVPDTYVLPEKGSLACCVIGNGVPPPLMRVLGDAWRAML